MFHPCILISHVHVLVYKFSWVLQNVDATQSMGEIQSAIREAAMKVVNECQSGAELTHMWPLETSKIPLQS